MHTYDITRKGIASRKPKLAASGENGRHPSPKSSAGEAEPADQAGASRRARSANEQRKRRQPTRPGAEVPDPVVANTLCRVAYGLAKHLPPKRAQMLISLKLATYNLGGRLTLTEVGRQRLRDWSARTPSVH